MSVSAGWGQVYEIAFVLVARLRQMRLFLHHHNFRYLDTPSALTRLLVRLASRRATHVTLSTGMGERLIHTYAVRRAVPVSNIVFVSQPPGPIPSKRQRDSLTVGFLSNIAVEKGIFEFLEVLECAARADVPLVGKVAGPFQDTETERAVRRRIERMSTVHYVGPKYGEDKDHFLSELDVLLFPTRYANEAEPLTVHEAMNLGIPVIAYGRGCLPEVVTPECGRVIDPTAPFAPEALAQLQSWRDNRSELAAASAAAATRVTRLRAESQQRWQQLEMSMLAEPEANHDPTRTD